MCAGVVLGHNITHTTAFDYDRVDLRDLNATEIAKTVSVFLYFLCMDVYTVLFNFFTGVFMYVCGLYTIIIDTID